MPGQEISAAGQLRLMTAQHHAAHQNPQGNTQGTYQVCKKTLNSKNNIFEFRMFFFLCTNSPEQF